MERITYAALSGFSRLRIYGHMCRIAWCMWSDTFNDSVTVYSVPKYGEHRLSIGEPAFVYADFSIDMYKTGQQWGCVCVDQNDRVWHMPNPIFECQWKLLKDVIPVECHDFEYIQKRLFDAHKFMHRFGGSCVLHSLGVFLSVCSSVSLSSANTMLQRVKYDTRNEIFLSAVAEFFYRRENYVVVEAFVNNPYTVVIDLLNQGYAVSINVPKGSVLRFQDRSVTILRQHRTCLVPIKGFDRYVIADVNGIGWYTRDEVKQLCQYQSDDWEWLVVAVSETNVEVNRVLDWLLEMSDMLAESDVAQRAGSDEMRFGEDVRQMSKTDSISDVSFFRSRGVDPSVEQIVSAAWQQMISRGEWLSAHIDDDEVILSSLVDEKEYSEEFSYAIDDEPDYLLKNVDISHGSTSDIAYDFYL